MNRKSRQDRLSIDEWDAVPKKSLWQDKRNRSWAFYCPSCKVPRRISYHPRPQPRHFAQIGLAAMFFTLITWNWFSLKGMVSFLPFWIAFEIIYRIRVRAALPCPQCGFDPILYLVDLDRARQEIEAHWRRKFAEKGIPYPEKVGNKEQPSEVPPSSQVPPSQVASADAVSVQGPA